MQLWGNTDYMQDQKREREIKRKECEKNIIVRDSMKHIIKVFTMPTPIRPPING